MTNLEQECNSTSISLNFLKWNVANVKLDKFPQSWLEKWGVNSGNM
jgi:hypothetical protein